MSKRKLTDDELDKYYSCSVHGRDGHATCKECWKKLGDLTEYYSIDLVYAKEDRP